MNQYIDASNNVRAILLYERAPPEIKTASYPTALAIAAYYFDQKYEAAQGLLTFLFKEVRYSGQVVALLVCVAPCPVI